MALAGTVKPLTSFCFTLVGEGGVVAGQLAKVGRRDAVAGCSLCRFCVPRCWWTLGGPVWIYFVCSGTEISTKTRKAKPRRGDRAKRALQPTCLEHLEVTGASVRRETMRVLVLDWMVADPSPGLQVQGSVRTLELSS